MFLEVFEVIRKIDPQSAREFWADVSSKRICFKLYGDDFLCGCPRRWRKWFNLQSFADFTKTWDIEVKMSASAEVDQFYSSIHDDKVVPGRDGVMFLKRRFVVFETNALVYPAVMLWRPLEDYLVRTVVTGSDLSDPAIALGRIYALQYDTMGTNAIAWEFLDLFADQIVEHFPKAEEELRLSFEEAADGLDDRLTPAPFNAFIKMVAKLGVDIEPQLRAFKRPARDDVIRMFLPEARGPELSARHMFLRSPTHIDLLTKS